MISPKKHKPSGPVRSGLVPLTNRQWYLAGGASTILEVIPNGTMVKKGDVLCTLDASEYEELARVQAINAESHKAEDVQRALGLGEEATLGDGALAHSGSSIEFGRRNRN